VNGLDGSTAGLSTATERILRRRTLAGMLSEALCSRARRISGRHATEEKEENEIPFARRAREQGKTFKGGKNDGESSAPFCVLLAFGWFRCLTGLSTSSVSVYFRSYLSICWFPE
jgi:hypothetical protein